MLASFQGLRFLLWTPVMSQVNPVGTVFGAGKYFHSLVSYNVDIQRGSLSASLALSLLTHFCLRVSNSGKYQVPSWRKVYAFLLATSLPNGCCFPLALNSDKIFSESLLDHCWLVPYSLPHIPLFSIVIFFKAHISMYIVSFITLLSSLLEYVFLAKFVTVLFTYYISNARTSAWHVAGA